MGLRTLIAGLFIVLSSTTAQAGSDDITVVTENFPPYNYEIKGRAEGVSTEVVRAILDRMELDASIQVYPWVRAYQMALNEPSVAIFSLARSPEREERFHWIGVVAPAKAHFYSLKSRDDIDLDSVSDAKEYLTGVYRNSSPESYLSSEGFRVDEHLMSVYDNQRLYRLLKLERIDLWVSVDYAVPAIVEKVGDEAETMVKPVLPLPAVAAEGLYLALSRETPVPVVERFREAYQSIRQDGTLERILSEHGMSLPKQTGNT